MPIRETFWNIPHWAEIAQYLLALVTVGIFTFGVIRRVRHWSRGQAERRMDRVGTRLMSVLTQAVLQVRTAREPYAGVMHLTIFWGMVMLFLGTILATIDWDVTHLFFDFQFLKGNIYIFYELILDIFGVLLLIGLGMAIYRRYFMRPDRLQKFPGKDLKIDDAYALIMLSLIAIGGYLVEGLRIAVVKPDWAAWSPVGNALAFAFNTITEPTNRSLHLVLWTGHTLIAFVFIASIPFTKLFHIFSVPTNIYFRSLQPVGALAPARYNSSPGVNTWQQFTWKQILDFEACTRCGRCQDECPAYASGLELSPRNLMIKLDNHIWQNSNGKGLHGEVVKAEELWACTSCRACSQACPAFVDHLSSIVDMRRYLVDEGEVDNLLQEALANLGRYGNSFGQSERMRARWTQALPFKIKDARRETVEYLWFVGDYASYNVAMNEITRKTAEVFEKAGLDFGILYDAERNAGNDVRRIGEEGLFEMLMEKNLALLNKCSYQAIVTTDPHSYNTLKNEYPAYQNGTGHTNFHPIVLHYSELLDLLIKSGQLKFSRKLDQTVSYQDPCYLGRYNNIYEAPRRVITATGCHLVEMPHHADQAFCCGAGGGRIWIEEQPVKERPSEKRLREAATLESVQSLIVACPKDVSMFKDAVKTTNLEQRLAVKDLIELVYEAL